MAIVLTDGLLQYRKQTLASIISFQLHFILSDLFYYINKAFISRQVNLERQQVSAARRKSLWETRGRATTRLSRTAGGKSRWRIDVAFLNY
jgi:hypothetical protein